MSVAKPAGGSRDFLTGLGIWSGIIGPLLYVLTFSVDGALRPGYSAYGEAISYLLLGPRGWLEIVNFLVLAVFLVLFAIGYYRWSGAMPAGWRRAGAIALACAGLGFVIAATFLPDPAGELARSVHAMLHNVAFVVVFLSLGSACLLVGGRFIRFQGWRAHGWYSIVNGLIALVAALGSLIPSSSGPPPWGGLFERALFFTVFAAWLILLASRMLMRGAPEG